MSNILLANPVLEDGWIDLSVGEPHLVRENLLKCIKLKDINTSNLEFKYPSPAGHEELVKILENKYGYPVVVTNGAKQAIGATFYAMQKMLIRDVGMRNPFWALMPELAEMHGIKLSTRYGDTFGDGILDGELVISPNNPDGFEQDLISIEKACNDKSVFMLHDGAYYTKIYTDNCTGVFGDVQVYSGSKMYGLSSMRFGFAVCKNQTAYKHILHYMEHMTVGVSRIQQEVMIQILKELDHDKFNSMCRADLEYNRSLLDCIPKDIVDFERAVGMFAWGKVHDWKAFKNAKLHVISGELFGEPDYVRINIGFSRADMENIVKRILLFII